jgi:NADH-quinone oxidoreductase subunit L
VTYGTFLLGTLAITGVPGFSGFFSKDEILWKAYGAGNPLGLGGKVLWGVGVVAAGMTAFYMFRLLLRAFYGEPRYGEAAAHHLHESPRAMAVPLVVLGVLSVAGGWVGIPRSLSFGADLNVFEHYLAPVFGEAAGEAGAAQAPGLEWGLMVLALAVVGAGILLATRFYLQKPELPERLVQRFPTLSRLVLNKYYVDELYQRTIIGPYMTLCRWLHVFDARVVDGAVNGARHVTIALSYVSRFFDQYVVDGLVNLTAYVARGLSLAFRRMQTGFVQAYLSLFVFGIFLFVSLYLFWQR